MIAVTIDVEGHVLLHAWAVVEGENADSWCYFMNHLKQAIPFIVDGTTSISDCNKGLMTAIDVLGPHVFPAHCCFHLCDNFKTKFGIRLTEAYFAKIANARTEDQYNHHLAQLRAEKQQLHII